MTNTALRMLRGIHVGGARSCDREIDLILQHNDPNILEYHHNDNVTVRKPDSIFMALSTARHIHGLGSETSWEAVANSNALNAPKSNKNHNPRLDWGDALASIEYKRASTFKGKVDLKPEFVTSKLEDLFIADGIWDAPESSDSPASLDPKKAGEKRGREPDDEGVSGSSSRCRL